VSYEEKPLKNYGSALQIFLNYSVKSPIDDQPMDGISNMRVHASFNYSNANYAIRLSDIYVVKV